MPKFFGNIDLNRNEIQNATIQPLTVAPSNPKEGQIYYNINDKNYYRYDGTSWVTYQNKILINGLLEGDGSGNISAAETQEVTTLSIDSSPIEDSNNLVTSGGVYTALQSFTETDPTVPSWAKAASKPSYTASEVGAAASSHSHGNITSGGDITATAPTVASGDQIIINDHSASKITNGPTFDGSTTSKYLSQKGTWENAPTAASIGALTSESDPVFSASAASGITSTDISNWNAKQNALTIDSVPTDASTNPVSSNGVYDMVMSRTKIYTASCATAAVTAAKVATLDDATNFSLTAGVMVAVRFTYGNSAASPTLNVNSSGAKSIAIPINESAYVTGNGTSYNTWGARETILFTYTGTYWTHLPSGRLGYSAFSWATSAYDVADEAYDIADEAYNIADGKQAKITVSGVLQGDGNGGVTAKAVDTAPTSGSSNLITSGAVYTAILGAIGGSY